MIESLARHEQPRIRAYAAGVIERDAVAQREIAESYREDERFTEAATDVRAVEAVATELWDSADAEDIPF